MKLQAAGAVDVDVHPHVKGGLGTLVKFMPRATRVRMASDAAINELRQPGDDPEVVAREHLDRLGLEAAVLLPLESLNGFTDPLTAAVYAAALNRYVAETWLPVDARYHLALLVPPHDPARAAREIRAHGSQPGVVGVFLPLLNILMGDRHYYPIYRAALEQQLTIVVHPAGPEGAFTGAPLVAGGIPATYLERHVALPQIAQANLTSLVLNGVFERFPDLRVVFAEFGFAWAVPLMWRMDMDWRRLRRETPWVRRPPSQYIRERVRFSFAPAEEGPPALMSRLLEMLGADRTLLFSSDYPHWDEVPDLDSAIGIVPPAFRERVLWESALETFPRLRVRTPAIV